ncbi:MAG TPA: protein phosphatase 2C domain-containing protein [Chthoniobacteraceae bacterium]|jgi:protein phosphatase|nr:protein phosphatase 2C domain-containing protein [Chthoniobacteraceae bacterium]
MQDSRRLNWFGQTDRGRIRKNNEDSFLAIQFDARETHYLGKIGDASLGHYDYVFAVSDGMGGEKAGEFASRITVETIARLLPRSYQQTAVGLSVGFEDVFIELFDQVHQALMRYGGSYDECAGMGATLSLCWFTPDRMYFGHIGDSRIYHLPAGGGIQQISHDDTHVGWLYRNAKLNEREARTHPRRNVLQRALGAGHQFVSPQVGALDLAAGDSVLLCSDGLVEGLFDSQILELIRTPAPPASELNIAQRLIHAAIGGATKDNITALVVEIV